MKLDKEAVAEALDEMGRLLATDVTRPYRGRAYERAARAIEGFAGDLDALAAAKGLKEIPGVGTSIEAAILELRSTGKIVALEALRAEFGPGFKELSSVPGLTPARIRTLYQALGITTVDQLRAACESRLVRTVRGFGARTEETLLESARGQRSAAPERFLLLDARTLAEPLCAALSASPACARVEVAGSVRRWREDVGGVDLCAAAVDDGRGARAALLDSAARLPGVMRVLSRDADTLHARLQGGMPLSVHIVDRAAFAYHLVALTGARAHVDKLQLHTGLRGCASEAEVYAGVGLPFIPPELREDQGEIEAARAGDAFTDLLQESDIRGMTHCHTTHSDGRATVAEMADAARARGHAYMTITDHSPSAHYARGVASDRLALQWAEIARAEADSGVALLRGTESDIRADGSLDYEGDVLGQLEIIIASIHERMKMTPEQMTARLVTAMRAPWFKIWGHALGRLVLKREPIACDVEAVLDAAASARAAIELNGDPHRLDLEPRWTRAARARGLRFVVSTDAHSVADLDNLPYAVALARRAGVRKHEVLNTLDVQAFRQAVRPG